MLKLKHSLYIHVHSLVPRPPLQLLSLAVRKAITQFFLHSAKKSCGVEPGNEANMYMYRSYKLHLCLWMCDQWRKHYGSNTSTVDPHLSDPNGTEPRPDMGNGRICKTIHFFNGENKQFYLMHSKNRYEYHYFNGWMIRAAG